MNNTNYTTINGIGNAYDFAISELKFDENQTDAITASEPTYSVYENNGGNYDWTLSMQVGFSEQVER